MRELADVFKDDYRFVVADFEGNHAHVGEIKLHRKPQEVLVEFFALLEVAAGQEEIIVIFIVFTYGVFAHVQI